MHADAVIDQLEGLGKKTAEREGVPRPGAEVC